MTARSLAALASFAILLGGAGPPWQPGTILIPTRGATLCSNSEITRTTAALDRAGRYAKELEWSGVGHCLVSLYKPGEPPNPDYRVMYVRDFDASLIIVFVWTKSYAEPRIWEADLAFAPRDAFTPAPK